MTNKPPVAATLTSIDDATARLVRVAAAVAASDERTVRVALTEASGVTPSLWIEEVLLQSYLFAGFPRALNAMRSWRRLAAGGGMKGTGGEGDDSAASAGASDNASEAAVRDGVSEALVREAGERSCRAVYGSMYERLRENIRELHPLLDEWMIMEGYGKVLSRTGLDLARRELCIVAACAASGQERQLHSHLHGALNVGVAPAALAAALDALEGLVDDLRLDGARHLMDRVVGDPASAREKNVR
jgi:4-carboxymuconolactone decarboxylase